MHCTCLFVETREQIACQDWIKVAGTHGDCTDVVEMAQQEAEVRPMLAIDPTCPHGLHYLADARGLCKMILVVANITVEVPGQSALEQLKTLRVPGLYSLLAKERRVGERVAAIMQNNAEVGYSGGAVIGSLRIATIFRPYIPSGPIMASPLLTISQDYLV